MKKSFFAPANPSDSAQDKADTSTHISVKFEDMSAMSVPRNLVDPLSSQAWEAEKQEHSHKPWNATPEGRAAIRLFSRGALGAAFFALGGRYSQESMRNYHMDKHPENFGQWMAYGFDHLVGKPIEKIANHLGYDGKAVVTFRPTIRYGTSHGRSLGHEVMGMTFDFASMSVGDGLGRDIARVFDPNQKQSWLKDGHVDIQQAVKSAAKNTWKYFTYNAGEDWAVAVPYVFYNRWSRNAIDKHSPGFAYDQDRRLNGGSFKVDKLGNVVGTYGLEGALDLQGRFTAYNIGTLMYREAYADIGSKLKNWYKQGLPLPHMPTSPIDIAQDAVEGVKSLAHWVARDTIKGALYMTPAVPFFWAFRTPQTKYRGVFINPQEGVVAYHGNGHVDVLHANEIRRSTNLRKTPDQHPFTLDTPTFFSRFENGDWQAGNPVQHQLGATGYDAYGEQHTLFDKALNVPGKINNTFRRALHKPITSLNEHYNINLDNKELRMKSLTDAYANAAFAYTPYFFMKSDVMAYYWDTAKMDMGIERTIDGVTHLNPLEVGKGMKEVWQSMWHKPFDNPQRELKARASMCNDESPPDGQYRIENANCVNEAIDDITDNKKYQLREKTKRFVERLEESQKRANGLFTDFTREAQTRYADMVGKPNRPEPRMSSFADQEELRKSDFPTIGTTIH